MPYIPDAERKALEADGPLDAAELTYVIYKAMVDYAREHGNMKGWGNLSQCITAAECAKLEFYRRHIGPYEDQKILENGDVV